MVIRPIVAVTLNPALDRTVWVDRLVPGRTHRSTQTRASIGGKGINVARTVSQLGARVHALGVAGEDQAAAIEQHLASHGVKAQFLATAGTTRTNLKVIERESGRLTEINGTGPVVSAETLASLESELLALVGQTGAAAVVLAGSLPPGIDASVYERWTRGLQLLGLPVRVLVDASDEALARAVRAGPFMVKPNRVEAERLVGRPIGSTDEAIAAARAIQSLGPQNVLLSLGSMGAVACSDGETCAFPASPAVARADGPPSTVGAGDAMLARIAVELARLDAPSVAPSEFFAMCRLAVSQAERHIAAAGQEARKAGH